jgi:hypothetical protein
MSTQTDFDRHAAAWLTDGPTELADRVLDAALREVHVTRQRPDLRLPWRFPKMSNLSSIGRAVLVGAVLLVAIAGGAYLVGGSSNTVDSSDPPSTPAATAARSTDVPSATGSLGIPAWTRYESSTYPTLTMSYPADWSVNAPATRAWKPGDKLYVDTWPYADSFVSAGESAVGLFAWEMPAGEGIDLDSVVALTAWARSFCRDVEAFACGEFTDRAVPMCLNAGGASCRAALLVPTDRAQYAFFMDWPSVMFTDAPDMVNVIVVAREDTFPSAVRYGGSVELLKSILAKMDVQTPRPGENVGHPPE